MSIVSILNENPNPIGTPDAKPEIQEYINNMAKQWDSAKVKVKGFWSKLTGFGQLGLVNVTKFLIYCLDGLIILVEELMEHGPDKKATVLSAIAGLYDYVSKDSLPIVLRPFALGIKSFIIYTVISLIIDFIVGKYKTGAWKKS